MVAISATPSPPYHRGLSVAGRGSRRPLCRRHHTRRSQLLCDPCRLAVRAGLRFHLADLRRDVGPRAHAGRRWAGHRGPWSSPWARPPLLWGLAVCLALVFGRRPSIAGPLSVAVIAIFKETGFKGLLRLLVESESRLKRRGGCGAVASVVGPAQARENPQPAQRFKPCHHFVGATWWASRVVAPVFSSAGPGSPVEKPRPDLIAAYGAFLAADHLGRFRRAATLAAACIDGIWRPESRKKTALPWTSPICRRVLGLRGSIAIH